MSTITTRLGKGEPLTFSEMDNNLSNLNDDKLENITNESVSDLSDVDTTGIADGQALVWDNANSKFIAGDAGVTSYNDLTDLPTLFDGAYSSLTGTPTIPADTNDLTNGAGYITDITSQVIDDLSNVQITTADSGQVLMYMASGQWENQTITSVSSLADLNDVDNSLAATEGQVLAWDNANGYFVATTPATGATELNDLTDVEYSGVGIQDGDILAWSSASAKFSSTGLTLATKSIGELSDVDTAGIADGDVLIWNDTNSRFENESLNYLEFVSEDTNPSLGGDLDGSGNTVSNVQLQNYKETIYDLGATDSPSIDITNGNVQKVTISAGLTLPAFTGAATGQSVTLIVSGSGEATGTGYIFANAGSTTLTNNSLVSIFYDGTNYWCSIATDFV